MSRKAAATGDSLDLLLDTICNTFGGILFIGSKQESPLNYF